MNAKSLRTLVLVMFGAWGASAAATLIGFSYTVTDAGPPCCSGTGSGSFSFADSPTSVGLGDLTGFSFAFTFTDSSIPTTSIFDYDLADLLSFTATLDSAQNVTALALETDFVGDSSGPLLPVSFTVTSLADAATEQCIPMKEPAPCEPSKITSGFITTSVIPEPATIFLLILAAAALIGHVFRSREVAPI